MSTLTDKQIAKCKKFDEIVKIRLFNGESKESAYRDKPDEYEEWAEENFKETGGIKLPKVNMPMAECWNCGKVYQGNKCPSCKAFKPKN